jgi:predicted  nucleic acid-binding Zn-ribbon protein
MDKVCTECGEDWCSGQRACPNCGCQEWDDADPRDTADRRTGGIDSDA